ncbi:tRNA (adenine(22)-N(1))-methyltransferase [Lactobacillus xylocopicola]|uniref:Methyltransferase n=1 Tax=Lactobacillus xylocopicola TaxID=2976676 RepID=A0ABN6SK27_9LACO|nr:class I SAM-dependent methyltransferase [Lactobacillus xylocopicola]BDR60529.1 methyltransferase [Lactobacillus xylocopicola]
MNLRLKMLASMVDVGARIADIGTDHAYLPIELVKAGKVDFAIASDIAKGPLANAQADISQAGLSSKIATRLGPGLAPITVADQVDTVIIAGMGGKLMTQILAEAWFKGMSFATLVLEPNVGEPGVRQWLLDHDYTITAESIVAEAGHTYELIKARQARTKVELSPEEIYFGPFLLQTKSPVFIQKWRDQLSYHEKLLLNLNKAKNKDSVHIKQIKEEITMIKGVLDDQS